MTCCEDRQSQMPKADVKTRVGAFDIMLHTITSQYQKLLFTIDGMSDNIRICGDNLVVGIEGVVLLEFEVAYRP